MEVGRGGFGGGFDGLGAALSVYGAVEGPLMARRRAGGGAMPL